MYDDQLRHYGILGMHWGRRKGRSQEHTHVTRARMSGTKEDDKKEISTSSSPPKKQVKDMSDTELKDLISRLELEKKYRDLTPQKTSKGKALVMDALDKAGKNMAGQVATYALGIAINKLAKKEIVNPKKGQKDK